MEQLTFTQLHKKFFAFYESRVLFTGATRNAPLTCTWRPGMPATETLYFFLIQTVDNAHRKCLHYKSERWKRCEPLVRFGISWFYSTCMSCDVSSFCVIVAKHSTNHTLMWRGKYPRSFVKSDLYYAGSRSSSWLQNSVNEAENGGGRQAA